MTVTFVLEIAAVSDYRNPTIQEIAGIIELLPWLPEDDFMIVERVDCQTQNCGGSYLQTFPQDVPVYAGLFVIEHRDGVAKRHYEGFIEAGAPLVEMFASYLNDDNLWCDAVVWRDISYQFEDLKETLPYEELSASFFADGEWEKANDEKRKRDEAFWDQAEEQ